VTAGSGQHFATLRLDDRRSLRRIERVIGHLRRPTAPRAAA